MDKRLAVFVLITVTMGSGSSSSVRGCVGDGAAFLSGARARLDGLQMLRVRDAATSRLAMSKKPCMSKEPSYMKRRRSLPHYHHTKPATLSAASAASEAASLPVVTLKIALDQNGAVDDLGLTAKRW